MKLKYCHQCEILISHDKGTQNVVTIKGRMFVCKYESDEKIKKNSEKLLNINNKYLFSYLYTVTFTVKGFKNVSVHIYIYIYIYIYKYINYILLYI